MCKRWTDRGICRQSFQIKADITPLIDYLTDKIIESIKDNGVDIDLDESYVDIDHLVINGSYDTPYVYSHCDATYLDPPEDDMNRVYLGDITLSPKFFDGLNELIKNIKVEEGEDGVDYLD